MLNAISPFSLTIFGASGHLAKLKLYPELYTLALKKRFPEQYAIVGFSRTEMDKDAFRKLVADAVREEMSAVNDDVLNEFLSHVYYHQGQYTQQNDFEKLNGKLEELESGFKDVVRLAYFSIPPTAFSDVAHNLCRGGVHNKDIPFRCIVEKPVGHNLKSFQEIKKELLECFKEEEIYLLDHYLGKEAVRNIFYLRLVNPIVERLFANKLIHHVEIEASESSGLEGRAGYFEQVGTFRDMFQSHLLMIASLLTMDLVEKDESILKSRFEALKQFYLPPAKDLGDIVLQGQYESGEVEGKKVPGYLEEEGVNQGSKTNTYAALKLLTRANRWQGVPFYLRSGKRMEKKQTRITIEFQQTAKLNNDTKPNRLCIILQGEAGMRIHLQTKMGGTVPKFRPLILEDPLVCVGDCLPEHSLMILEAIHGKRQWFLQFPGVQAAWRLIDPIQAHLEKEDTPLYKYKAGSQGPKEAEEWIANDGVEWIST